ncbi:aspartate/glutamate racemase family protein [Paracoccus spongiarum]|uniref:Aspartate/glutamate racemase family protein n=1 Tax=Paracoccus spongiarum TaxID=3064387 RepID=A0ABT9J9K0_9RHOB|nr:aspartate/glutamate racemase family protein [Paracoccus sp. 2205BS29-5]MDP5305837.1 aspartate/glutamate racemase family protein [Paracoccus sp. 2205BS29-5]
MKLFVINPNSTASMTEKIIASARAVAAPGVQIEGRTAHGAPASIEGHFDEVMCAAHLLREVQEAERAQADAIVVACFDDPAIGACREVATGPVIGICEAAVKAASMIATSFSVVTTLPRSVPVIEELVRRYGLDHQCRRVRSAAIPVLALEEPGSNARLLIRDEILRAIDEDGCEAVVLGCAGMADLTEWLSLETGIPVIDGVSAATKFAEALVGAGLKTSKIGAYAVPNAK